MVQVLAFAVEGNGGEHGEEAHVRGDVTKGGLLFWDDIDCIEIQSEVVQAWSMNHLGGGGPGIRDIQK